MGPAQRAMAFGVVRWLMAVGGMYGIDLPVDALEPFVNGTFVIVPLVWSVIQKRNVDRKIKSLQAGQA